MGQCGCGDFMAQWKLQGPDGTLYALQIYNGCRDCETPIGVIVYRLTKSDDFFYNKASDLPDLPIHAYGDDPSGDGDGTIKVLDPLVLRKALTEWAESVAGEYDADGLMHDGINECLAPALWKSQREEP